MGQKPRQIAILGCGNIGGAIALGLTRSGRLRPKQVTLTRRKLDALEPLAAEGFPITSDNREAVRGADAVLVAVDPQHAGPLLREIAPAVDVDRHVLISTVSGLSVAEIRKLLERAVPIVRAMPNTAVAIRESMTCLAVAEAEREENECVDALETARSLFDPLGRTLVIDEDQMIPATSLCACGIAFFLRAIRAASQGGIEIGFHSSEALLMAAQTAKGAASLLLQGEGHPEGEIDRVTTPRGCTISGLNRMEHEGFSSAMIRGIVVSAEKAARLYIADEK